MNEKEIKEKLAKIIAEDSHNIDEILRLSHELASLDKNNVRFSVDASVIDRLGMELVARHETAVSELIKNSYDADAKSTSINFLNVDNIGGSLIIEDNGSGMTRDQLVNGFMKISSTSKIHEPESPLYKRKRAGKKGIGRFSTQRLGNKLTIITQTEDSDIALKVIVDWEKYKMDGDLIFITNQIEEIPKTKEKGTTLRIDGLREWWSEAMIKRVYRYAIDILQPFPLAEIETEENQEIKDPGFEIKCLKDGNEIADQQSMFYKHAVAEIEGHIDKDGLAYWDIKNSRIPNANTETHQYFSKDDKKERKIISKIEGCGTPLGEKFEIRNGFATLKNNIYVFKPIKEDKKYYYLLKDNKEYKIEKDICKNTVKPNTLKSESELKDKTEKLIFPYNIEIKDNDLFDKEVLQLKIKSDIDFKLGFPFAYKYLEVSS